MDAAASDWLQTLLSKLTANDPLLGLGKRAQQRLDRPTLQTEACKCDRDPPSSKPKNTEATTA
jgi:hypothetical protein